MNILVILTHPSKQSFCSALAEEYIKTAKAQGHEVEIQTLSSMKFDPLLRMDSAKLQSLEPDLEKAQQQISWADHLVFVYPVWWGGPPALLKGYLDRVFTSGFAFKYHEHDPFWDKLLKGKSAQIITTSDSPAFWLRFVYGNSDLGLLKSATLEFCGVKPVKTHRFDRIRSRSDQERKQILASIARIVPGRKA